MHRGVDSTLVGDKTSFAKPEVVGRQCLYTNQIISRFIASFNAEIKHNRSKAREQNRYAHDCKDRYVWAREVGW